MNDKKDHPFKSKNMPLPMKLYFMILTITFRCLEVISPKLAGKLALHLFTIPPKVSAPQRESKIREKAYLSYREINNNSIAVRVWESKKTETHKPTILLSHGWAGRTTQFLEIIESLVDAGYRVVGADISAHGDSSGKQTNILEGSQILSIIAKEFGPLTAIIGHSFGTGTILLGMDKFGIDSPKVVLIGAYSRISFILDLFSSVFNLNQTTKKTMQQVTINKFSNTYGIKWDWKNIAPINTIKSYHGDLLFIHDDKDHEVPLHEVIELHQSKPNAETLITTGFGHRRILRNKEVVNTIVSFIQD